MNKTKIFSESNTVMLEQSINDWFDSLAVNVTIHSQQMVYDQHMQYYVMSVIYSYNNTKLNS